MGSIKELDDAFVAHTYARFPVEIVSGEGSVLTDSNGKEYIDFGSGIGVTAFGHRDAGWIAAVTEQLGQVAHTSNLYYTGPCARLAALLCERTGMSKVFFSNSGAEANECAVKIARKYASDRGTGRQTVLTLRNSFHGRTLTTLAATGQEKFHALFQPLTPGFAHTPANDLPALERAVQEYAPAAILMECVQGEGGVIALDRAFVRGAEAICRERGMLLMIDEVQTGNGRTGELYSYMNFDVHPDVVTTAKGLGGGLPIGATLMSERVANVLGAGDHGSTFGGNPIACAGAYSILSRIDEAVLEGVRRKSRMIFSALEGAKGVRSVSGMGLMIGVLTERPAGEILAECRERGLLCLSAKEKVRLLPALNIPDPILERGLDILRTVCAG